MSFHGLFLDGLGWKVFWVVVGNCSTKRLEEMILYIYIYTSNYFLNDG